jgi:hypothetical protein
MKHRRLLVAGLIVMLFAVFAVRVSQGSTSLPPGVTAEMWRPLSENAGIVIQPYQRGGQSDVIVGTLMVREGNRWRTVELVPGTAGLVPAR